MTQKSMMRFTQVVFTVIFLSSCASLNKSETATGDRTAVFDTPCQKRTTTFEGQSCEYTFCALSVHGYSNQVSVLIPQHITPETTLRVHLHGYSQFKNGMPYDPQYYAALQNGYPKESIEKSVNAFGMQQSVCENPQEVLVMPMSFGQGDDYRKSLKSYSDLKTIIQQVSHEILQETSKPLETMPLHLSGQGAGGQKLIELLTAQGEMKNLKTLSLYEGLTKGSVLDAFKKWIDQNPGLQVNLYTLTQGTSYRNTRMFFGKLTNDPKGLTAMEVKVGRVPAANGENLTVDQRATVTHVKAKADAKTKTDAYDLVKRYWKN